MIDDELCDTSASDFIDDENNSLLGLGFGGSYFPSGQTYRASVYYSQSINGSYRFNLYDYGRFKNKKVYGQNEPPVVPLDAFDLPTALQSGLLDHLAAPEDVAWLTE